MYQIIWSNKSKSDYFNNIDFLLTNWNENQAKIFILEVDRIIEIIRESPQIFPINPYRNTRKATINKHVQMYYRIDFDRIEILRFWNTHQNPENFKLSH